MRGKGEAKVVAEAEAGGKVEVLFTAGSQPRLEPKRVRIVKGRDTIVWRCQGAPEFTVCFEAGTPFREYRIHKEEHRSGPVWKDAMAKVYRYTIQAGEHYCEGEVEIGE